MIVAGGIYLEICVSPQSTGLYGSGGRAAIALADLSQQMTLHGFQPLHYADEVYPNFDCHGIDVVLHACPSRVAFTYLYPLAKPRITPVPLPIAGTAAVSGKHVLRFGCLEGDFKVDAEYAVYDPQTAVAPESFRANGSRAGKLAIVLNRGELKTASGSDSIENGARYLMKLEQAEVVVVKSGPQGAWVFAGENSVVRVPAFATDTVFKVGSGDVFSAAFAHYWAEAAVHPVEAALLASRHTADYVESRLIPLKTTPSERPEATGNTQKWVEVAFADGGTTAEWLREEALSALTDLSVNVDLTTVASASNPRTSAPRASMLLVISQFSSVELTQAVASAREVGLSVIVYVENASSAEIRRWNDLGALIAPDLTSALYRAAWG